MIKKLLTAVIVIALTAVFFGCQAYTKTKIISLKGPTSVGLSQIIKDGNYDVNIVAQPDAVVSDLASGKTDIALLPTNLAYNLYEKEKNITAIDINTLSVTCAISQNATELDNKKIYMTGKGAIPEILVRAFVANPNIEFKSEASEVIAFISKEPDAVGIVNEPQATIAINKNQNLKKIVSPLDEVVTGVTVVNNEFLKNHKDKVDQFIKDHNNSVENVKRNTKLAIETGIFENTDFIDEAVKNCNICCITGINMKNTLNDFYIKLQNNTPDDNFYYVPQN